MKHYPLITAGIIVLSGMATSIGWAQATPAVPPAAPPQIFVNRAPVVFQGQPAVERDSRLLVPLRGILEKLGAFVSFDSASQTVSAFTPTKRIALTVGTRQAFVNDLPVNLDTPAEVLNGSTMVPLRFLAESLGADVTYDVTTNTVAINTRAAAPAPVAGDTEKAKLQADEVRKREDNARKRAEEARLAAELKARTTDTSISGTVTAVYADVMPQRIVVRVPNNTPGALNGEKTFSLQPNTVLTIQRPDTPEQRVTLDHVDVGATVAVLVVGDDRVSAVNVIAPPLPKSAPAPSPKPAPAQSLSTVFKGTFLDYARSDRNVFVLRTTDGRQITIPKGVPVYFDNQKINADDLRSGDIMTITIDPRTHNGTRIVIAPE